MKKLVLLASMMLAFVTVKAQSEVGGWSLRPTVGMNIGFMTNADDSDPRFGLVVGAELEYQATDMLGISGGLLYSQQGAKMKDMDMDGTMKLDYINVPVLANFYVAKGFAFKVGLQPSFLVNDKVKASAGSASVEAGLGDLSNGFMLAVPIGLSYEFSNIQLDARFNWGVTHAISDSYDSCNSNVVMITLGYKFSL